MKTEAGNRLGTEKIGKLMLELALPSVLAQIVNVLYNIVDRIYIGRIPGVGAAALTGVGVTFPIITIISAFAGFTNGGGAPLAAIALGQGNKKRAEKILGNSTSLLLFFSVILMALFLIFKCPLLYLFGASAHTISYSSAYITVYLIGTVFVELAVGLNTFISCQGHARTAMMSVLIGAIANIVLDPILIFGLFGFPRMEVAGAAVATVTGQIVAAVAAIILNQKKNHEVKINMKGFRPSVEVIAQIYEIGIPSIVMQAISSVMTYGMNLILISFSATATAVFGIYFKLQSFIFMPVFGLNNGVIPIVAYNYGAQKRDRVLSAIRHVITYAVVIMILGLVIFQTMPDKLLMMFSASETMLAIGVPALRTISLSFLLAGFCIAAGSVFQALGKSIYSMYVSVARQLVVLLPVAYALSRLGRVELVWWAIPIAELMSLAMTVICMIHINKNIISKIGKNS